MDDSRYFLIHSGKRPELFRRKKELNEMVNILIGNGTLIEDIWIIKGKRLQVVVKEVEVE